MVFDPSDDELIRRADALHVSACRAQRKLLATIAEVDRREAWIDSGARDAAHWVAIQFQISFWKALRWLAAAQALESLPWIAESFERGELSIDQVVELTRFATPDTEARLIRWARGVSSGAIRARAELERRREAEEVRAVESARGVHWGYYQEGTRFGLSADLPAAYGPGIVRRIEREMARVPVLPGEDGPFDVGAHRADAFVSVFAAAGAEGEAAGEPLMVVHVPAETLAGGNPNAMVENGPVIPAETARRLACNARIQVVLEDQMAQPVHFGRLSREPSAAMMRQLRYRDRECRFPGCGARRFTHAHHIEWWSSGGRTDLENLLLVCSFHHRLVHEHGWKVARDPDGSVTWFGPGGVRRRAGPAVAA
ncbi:MAG TPA: DUF222 domain-containing protein [Actinomycetota bacterium]|nr:DUF222 domain-containing protein [Actinomycetota bacterium]